MINFKKVRYKNLLSSGNKFTEIQLDQHQTTLILGDNGAGKSTLLDALCFGMYGKGFRNLKKDLLINSINGGNLWVEVEFSIGKKEYKVIRGAKPNKFELYVNDVFVNQDATVRDYQEHLEKNILKMSYRSFTQVAILGSANFTPFMQLKATERRKLVEDLLDISIFSTMGDILKKKISNHTVEVRENNHEIDLLEERINGLNEQLNALRENRESKILKYESTVDETQENINNLLGDIDEKTKNVVEKTTSISDKDSKETRLKQVVDMEAGLENARKKALKDIEFYENNDDCPTCKQGLDHEHKKKHIEEKQTKISEIKEAIATLDEQVEDLNTRIQEINGIQDQITKVQKEVGILQTEVVSNQKFIQKIQKEIEELKKEGQGNGDVQSRIDDSEDKLNILHAKKESLVDQQHYYEIAQVLLRDQGVRQKIIKQ